jgi:hypothetical protein
MNLAMNEIRSILISTSGAGQELMVYRSTIRMEERGRSMLVEPLEVLCRVGDFFPLI